ncbi:MAG: ABC transporter ATP-binding protein [Chitinophagaceae bacterium]
MELGSVAHNTIVFKNLTKTFIEKKSKKEIGVFKNFSLELPVDEHNKIVTFIGKSGSGKTTLLRLVSGLEKSGSGSVTVNNIPVAGPTQQTSLVPQHFTCFPWLNVYENIAFGLEIKKSAGKDDIVKRIAGELDLLDRLEAYPKELSGGMQQRVAIGRAMAVDAPILLMDEPFSSLDAETREELQEVILKIAGKPGKLIVLVTHDLAEAILLSDVIFVLPERPIAAIADVVKITFERPRRAELIYTREFHEIYQKLRTLL